MHFSMDAWFIVSKMGHTNYNLKHVFGSFKSFSLYLWAFPKRVSKLAEPIKGKWIAHKA